jgi:3-hydroxyisobutyrate dehydrogenase
LILAFWLERSKARGQPAKYWPRNYGKIKRNQRGATAVKISFLGTGLMGLPMAQRLVEAGHDLLAYNRTASKLADWPQGKSTTDPGVAIAHGTYLFLMLTDGAAIQQVLLPHLDRLAGKTVVQMGTIDPATSQDLARQICGAGGDYLEAPVLGSIPEAKSGQLLIMGGARPETWEKALPLLKVLGSNPMLIGEVGQGAALKLALNQTIGALTVGFAQSLAYLQQQQVDIDKFMEILRASALYAPTFDKKLDRMLTRNYSNPNFPTKHLQKDLNLFAQSATGLNLAGVRGLQAIVDGAIDLGWAEGDYSALLEGILAASAKSPAAEG